MTDQEIREKAIADVAAHVGVAHRDKIAWVRNRIEDPRNVEERSVEYAVSQREKAIRRGELLQQLINQSYSGGGAFDKTCIECGRRFEYEDQEHYDNCLIGRIETELERE